MDIQGNWKSAIRTRHAVFMMENFIDKRYPETTLTGLNNIRIFMQVVVLSDMTKDGSTKVAG